MQDILGVSLEKLKKIKAQRKRFVAILLVLSLVVSLDVFWVLRKPGLTLAGNADCKITEHTHGECQNGEEECTVTEHIHDLSCYSDKNADVETQLDWQKMFADYPFTQNLQKDLVGIAKTQVGYTESKANFEVGDDGIRRGYTRYGAWYGAEYSDWSAIFVSFCLNYAGADPKEYPANTGADSMAKLWQSLDKFALKSLYDPVVGDLVFFKNNTVGIIAEIQNSTILVIRGDINNSVSSDTVPLTDSSISGWGITGGGLSKNKDPSADELFDISNGPAFYIIEGSTEGGQAPKKTKMRSLKAPRNVIDLVEYLNANGGSYFFTLLDQNNQELPKDASGNYLVEPDIRYKLTITFTSAEGFVPGTFQYQIIKGAIVEGGEGDFVLKDGTHVGDWDVTDDGLITLNFNEHMNSRTDITISATVGIHFPEQDEPIDFDGKISVTIQKPTEEKELTTVTKWGEQGNESNQNKSDPTKLYWNILVEGHKDSNIVGSVLTDNVISGEWLGDHKYTESDIEKGLTFGVSEPDPVTGQAMNWHRWVVYADDPNLNWTETGWSYTMPQTATCEWCGEVRLGNNNWSYTLEYTSTPVPANISGAMGYMNKAGIEGQYVDGWASFTHGEIHGELVKKGSFVSDAGGGSFLWELEATIPGLAEDKKAEYFWFIMDYTDIRDDSGNLVGYITNDANKASVTANYNGGTVQVPHIFNATENDPYAWHNYWSSERDGVYYGRQMNLLCRCHCTEKTCKFWNNGKCGSEYWFEGEDGWWHTNGYCQCWTAKENTTFTFVYKTDDLSVIEKYGGFGYKLRNEAVLYNRPNSEQDGVVVSNAQDSVTIPGIFKKDLTHDFDGYTANYKITVNEGKLNLTDGTPLTIHDVMTNTLVYVSGSMVITAEDANGNLTTLTYGEDYTVTYDGTGNQTDSHGKPVHILDIVILKPQPVKYIIDYDTTLTIPHEVTEAIKYSNSASITLWGQEIGDDGVEKIYADINIASKNYKTELYKTSALTGEALAGATFGFYNAQGGLITTGVTDDEGKLIFQSDIIEGIILREHQLYYAQELRAPPGYKIDSTKHWFCFCDEEGYYCKTCNEIISDTGAVRIPFEQVGKIYVANELMDYNLPATGGPGIYPILLASVIFIITPFVYKFIRRRKQKRRGVG